MRKTTFATDTVDRDLLETVLLKRYVYVSRSARNKSLKGKTITLKLRYSDFRAISRSYTLPWVINLDDVIYEEVCRMLGEVALKQPLRLIGVTPSNLTDIEKSQLSLFTAPIKDYETLTKIIDIVKEKYGEACIKRAKLIKPKHNL